MQYYIETGRFVAITCDLNDSQAERFFRWVVSKKQGALFVPLYGAEGRALVIFSHQGTDEAFVDDCEPKSGRKLEDEAKQCWNEDARLWDNIKDLDEFYHKHHYEWSTKIYPKLAVPDDAPDDFIGKQRVRYKDLKDLKDRGVRVPPFIANYLQTAENIVGGNFTETDDATNLIVDAIGELTVAVKEPKPFYQDAASKGTTFKPAGKMKQMQSSDMPPKTNTRSAARKDYDSLSNTDKKAKKQAAALDACKKENLHLNIEDIANLWGIPEKALYREPYKGIIKRGRTKTRQEGQK